MTISATPGENLALEEKNKQEFILSQNLSALIAARNETLEKYSQAAMSIPETLVRLKWENRHEIYSLQIKEEVYGAVINEITRRYPQLKAKIMARLEANYQQLKKQETATLTITRKLSGGDYKTTTVLALPEEPVNSPGL